MTAYDVGGSHTGNQTGYRHLRLRRPEPDPHRRHRHDRRHQRPTPATSTSAASKSSRSAAPAATRSAFAGGAVLSISVKSGGDRFTGNWYSDCAGDATISRQRPRLPAGPPTRRDEDGFFVAHRRSTRGNPIDEAVRHQRQRRRPAVEAEGVVLLQLAPERPVQVHPRPRRHIAALEADQQLHLQGHVPADTEQPDHRLPQQAREAAGQARHRPDHAAVGGATTRLAQLPVEGRVDERARQPRVPRRAVRQLVQLLPAAPDRDFGLYDGPWGPGRIDTADQPVLRRRRQQRLPGPEALQAAVLRHAVVLQGRLEGQPRLQVRLRLEARPPQPLPAISRSTSSIATTNGAARTRSTSTTRRRHRHQRRRLQRRLDQRHVEAAPTA